MKVLKGLAFLTVFALLGSGPAWGDPQSNAQQKCINKINKDTIKVHAAQGKLNAGCVKDAVKTGSNAETCLNADAAGKVTAKAAKTTADEIKLECAGTNAPDFAYTSAATANSAAITAEKNLIHDAFSNPVDGGLFLCDIYPAECLCQRQTIDRVEKLFRAMSKIFVKCKNAALAIGKLPEFPAGASSAADIERCVTDGTLSLSVAADTKGKVANAVGQLSATALNFCGLVSTNDPFSAGVCSTSAPPNVPVLVDCLEQRARCRFCQMINAADSLSVNCATWSGGTCP